MKPAEFALLSELIETGKTLRPLGDARLAQNLQSDGLVIIAYLEEMPKARITPTHKGRCLYALQARQKAARVVA